MNVLMPTDSFPPGCGGSGWSTYELARGLRGRGHQVTILHVRPGTASGIRDRSFDGFPVRDFGAPAPDLPYVRNYFKNERLHARLARYLREVLARDAVDVVHAQHVMSSLPSIAAGRRTGTPVVCTVRDYWPVCYWADLIHTRDEASLCPGCSASAMTRCIRPRAGAAWPLALPMIPYMRRNLARKRVGLAAADALIAVSSTLAADLKTRAPELAQTRLEIIPNPVDVSGLWARAKSRPRPLEGPYALYLGKLASNKGAEHLVRVAERAALDWPLIIAGDGPDRARLEAAAAASSRDVRLVGWVDQDAAAAWLGHASVLVFTSRGPESLSRVLLDASALGIPIAAMDTGGTRDIVEHEQTGLLSRTVDGLAADVKRLRDDAALRTRLGASAMRRAEERFDSASVVGRIEQLYLELRAERS